MVGVVFKAEHKQTTAMRFKTSEFYDLWIIDIDEEYDANEYLVTG